MDYLGLDVLKLFDAVATQQISEVVNVREISSWAGAELDGKSA
jgi:hypothetical protein